MRRGAFSGLPKGPWPLTAGGPSTILQGSGRFGPFRLRLGALLGVPRPAPAPSSSGLGHRLFTPATGVRVPLGSIMAGEWRWDPTARACLSATSTRFDKHAQGSSVTSILWGPLQVSGSEARIRAGKGRTGRGIRHPSRYDRQTILRASAVTCAEFREVVP